MEDTELKNDLCALADFCSSDSLDDTVKYISDLIRKERVKARIDEIKGLMWMIKKEYSEDIMDRLAELKKQREKL